MADAVDPRFSEFLERVKRTEMPPELFDQMKQGLTRKYQAPPVGEIEVAVRKRLNAEKARELLFYPSADDMQHYPALLAGPPDAAAAAAAAADTHPLRKLQITAMAPLYLAHCRSWSLMKPFIESGGLQVLAATLACSNLYLASQAMETLLSLTSEDLYPWFEPPTAAEKEGGGGRGGPKTGPDAAAWRAMFDLASGGALVTNLTRHHPDTFPGSGLMALRLFAFSSSWLRLHFTPDGVLRLSRKLLDLLAAWGDTPDPQQQLGGGEAEAQLARALHEDFSRFPPAEEEEEEAAAAAAAALSGPDGGGGAASGVSPFGQMLSYDGAQAAGGDGAATTRVVVDRTAVNPEAPNEAEAAKEAGNAAFKAGDYSAAIQHYSAALDVLVPAARLVSEGPRRAWYHANRAAAYLARADHCLAPAATATDAAAGAADAGGAAPSAAQTSRQQRPLRPGDCDRAGLLEGVDYGAPDVREKHYDAALLDCNAALDFDATCAKAHYRKAQALRRLGRLQEALQAAGVGASAVAAAGGSSSSGAMAAAADLAKLREEIATELTMKQHGAKRYSVSEPD